VIEKLKIPSFPAALHTAMTDHGLRERAAAFGEKIRAEDGVGQAVRIIAEALRGSRERLFG